MTSTNDSAGQNPARAPSPKLAAIAVALVTFALVLFIDDSERTQAIKDERLHVTERLSVTRAKLETAINASFSASRAIAVVFATHPDLSQHEFASLAKQAGAFNQGIIDIALFRDTAISDIHPHKGNEKLIGLDLRKLPTQWPAFRNMMITQQPLVAGPMKLVERNGSEGVVVRVPVYRAERFIGAIGTPILLDSLLRGAGLTDLEETMHVAVRGRDGKGSSGEVFYGDPAVFDMNPVVQEVSLPGGQWEIASYPRPGWGKASPVVHTIRLLGLAICLLATFWTYGMFRHLRLRAVNEQRLKESELQLKLHDSALNAAASAIVITDRKAHITWANRAFTKLTGYEFEEAVGRHCGELIKSGHQDRQFYEEMWQAILSGQEWHGESVNRRKDGTLYHDEMTITPVSGKDGEITHFVALKQDISARKISEEHLKNLAFYDPLTLLPNRRLLIDRLGQTLAASKRSGRYGALMFLDLDNFKPLNDEHGHDVGDLLLMEAARRISNCVREEDTVARFGGDEFVVMLKELEADSVASASQANGVAEKIRAALARPYRLELLQAEDSKTVVEHFCTSSIGIVLFVNHEYGEQDILKWADIAMYRAKAAGGNTIHFYDPARCDFSGASGIAIPECLAATSGERSARPPRPAFSLR